MPGLEPVVEDGRTLLPLVSAGRVLGGILAERVTEADGLAQAQIVAGSRRPGDGGGLAMGQRGRRGRNARPADRLPNHIGFQSVLGRELARARRTGQSLAVSLVDLDGLSGYIVRNGATAGERVLRLAADGLAGGVRSYDCVCRMDVGEFALVLPGMTAESAAALVGRLASGIGSLSADDQPITVSAGVAAFPEHAASDDLTRLAGAALQQAVNAGGGRVVAWNERPEVTYVVGSDQRVLEARGGHSAEARAVSEYAGHLAAALGLDASHVDRVRLAALLDDPTAERDEQDERRRTAERVAAGMIDEEAAGWLLARFDPVHEAPLEARAIAVADAFVAAGGHRSQADAGLALAVLWQDAGDRLDAGCVARSSACWPRTRRTRWLRSSRSCGGAALRCRAAIAASGRGVGTWPVAPPPRRRRGRRRGGATAARRRNRMTNAISPTTNSTADVHTLTRWPSRCRPCRSSSSPAASGRGRRAHVQREHGAGGHAAPVAPGEPDQDEEHDDVEDRLEQEHRLERGRVLVGRRPGGSGRS